MEDQVAVTGCPKCGHPWDSHEFGVPAPYCPITVGDRMIASVTQDFNETFATKADCTGFMARMIATGDLPEGVDPDNAHVKQVIQWCKENTGVQ